MRTAAEDCLAALSGNPCVQNVEARTPSLEEIFVAYMQQGGEAGAGQLAKEEAKP